MTDHRTVSFISGGVTCDAWFFPGAEHSPFEVDGTRPVVVMAHGFAGTKDSGLEPFAQRLAAAGLAVFAFDYRGFGRSGGTPRQTISMRGQQDDYRAAITAAKAQAGVDSQRVVLWGVSQSGGHALIVAAERADIAAVIALVPMVDGLAAGRHAYALVGPRAMARSTVRAVGSTLANRMGRAPSMMKVVGAPGEDAALTADGFLESYLALAGPSWRNEVDASVGLELGSFRVDKAVDQILAPVFMQIADFDQGAPPHAAATTAFKARARVRHYPCDHFDVFDPNPWFEPTVTHQIDFLARELARSSV